MTRSHQPRRLPRENGEGRGRIASVQSVVLPQDSLVKRIPSRPPEFRGPDFDARFDCSTLIFDAVGSADGRTVRLLCPALLNLREALVRASIRARPSGQPCRFTHRQLDRHEDMLVEVEPGTTALEIASDLGTFAVEVSQPRFDWFAGERVLLTLSKNNELVWLQDWARFHRDRHGATALLLYDNGSTRYGVDELLAALEEVEGLNRVVVVQWPFRHGPPGHGSKRYWDSNFSQLGMFADARWRFLQGARSVLNCDVDELVMSRSGASVFAATERSRSGVTSFFGDWVFGIQDVTRDLDDSQPARFTDYRHALAPVVTYRYGLIPRHPMRCNPKWAVVPARCPLEAQWHTHTINGWWRARLVSRDFRFRHFREISTNWKYDRSERERFDPARHAEDPMMRDHFARVDWAR
ncbi:hypothetical protein [Aureimonas sp. AU20]|uniref:hypothetical protein n=1 Tax=Aureimonas sp. AU20 TaxID=1349819 RepID=UPI000722787A|nr:hypothetical protein [Aureimonas sp. AU20]ALN72230.1 hypothetical protein M673_05850 [Aureimonas sp. AU20]